MSENAKRIGKVARWIVRILYLFILVLISILPYIKLEWQLPSVELSEEIEANSFSTLADLAYEYVNKHTIGTYQLSYLSLEYDKALHTCTAAHFEYSHVFLKYSCRISFNPMTEKIVGKWSNQQVFKNKLNMPTWDLQLEDMIKVSDFEWSSFTITANNYPTEYESNYDCIYVKYYNGEEEVMSISFKSDDLPYWLR